jgi:hypothetical protein
LVVSKISRIIAGLSVALTLAVGAATASAGEFNVKSNGSYVQVPPSSTRAIEGSGSPTYVRVTPAVNGFAWGDAGIGAAGGAAIVLLVGGGLVASQRRPDRIGHA